jgi:type VI protein secretion system component VasK
MAVTRKGEKMLLAAETTFLDVLWYSILFFFWILAIWIFIMIVSDVFRRDDLSGGKKALWIVFMIILPFVGVLTYIIVRPKVTAQDVRLATQAEAAQKAAAGVSTADELAKLSQLKSSGVINDAEYEELKKKTLATT